MGGGAALSELPRHRAGGLPGAEAAEAASSHLSAGFGLRPADGGSHQYYGVGVEHIAFEVDSNDQVDDAHARAASAGAHIHFPPEHDRDEPGYYAFFVFDPDGIRIEVFAWGDSGGSG